MENATKRNEKKMVNIQRNQKLKLTQKFDIIHTHTHKKNPVECVLCKFWIRKVKKSTENIITYICILIFQIVFDRIYEKWFLVHLNTMKWKRTNINVSFVAAKYFFFHTLKKGKSTISLDSIHTFFFHTFSDPLNDFVKCEQCK